MERRTIPIATALLAVVLLAGCDSSARPPADDGVLRIAMSTFSEGTFLPWNGSTGRKFYLDTIYEYLAYVDPQTQQLQPGLAASWEMSPDGLEYRFRIRPGVQFHAGWGELTAADVKYTIDRIRDPRSIAGPASPLRTLIADTATTGRYELLVRLTTPDIDFVLAYLSNALIVPILCQRYVEARGDEFANAHPIGTGPYVFAGQRPGAEIVVRRHPDADRHWRSRPQYEEVRFLAVPEEFTRAAMLKAGEVDLAPINYDSIAALRGAGLGILFLRHNWAPVIRLGGLVPRFPNPSVPWARREVRQALNHAIDKRVIVQSIFHGHVEVVGADFPAPQWAGIEPYPYDPERARQLLAAAGYPDGFRMTVHTFTTNPGAELPIIAEAIALYWRAIGVHAEIVPTTWTALRSAWTTGRATDIAWTHRGLAFAGTLAGLHASVMSGSLFSSFASAEIDEQVRAIGAALDPEERSRRITALGQHLRDEAAAIYIGFANEPYGASRKIGNWPALSTSGTNIDLITGPAR